MERGVEMKEQEVKKAVRQRYARAAKQGGGCGCAAASPCCGGTDVAQNISKAVGYSDEEIGAVPEGANLGLGCGNPVALASLKEGEVVLDLGAGAGFDCFLAAHKVGKKGKVIGVDMTSEMIDKARENARRGGYANVEFRLGEIENLPAADNSVDAVISNCVINLAPDKKKVFSEAHRVLKPGGRLMISDLVLLKELPLAIKASIEAYVGCISGAMLRDAYLEAIREAGLKDVRVVEQASFPVELMADDETAKALMKDLQLTAEALRDLAGSVVSVKVEAVKPKTPARRAGGDKR
jgi:ubiquinone/menaquinone biosynthesis C-methylase UbiE